jgi:hypothetical protein
MIEADATSIGLGEEKGSVGSERWQRGARESVLAEEGLRRRGAPSARVMPAGTLPPDVHLQTAAGDAARV